MTFNTGKSIKTLLKETGMTKVWINQGYHYDLNGRCVEKQIIADSKDMTKEQLATRIGDLTYWVETDTLCIGKDGQPTLNMNGMETTFYYAR